MKDRLKGCHFRSAVDVQVASKTVSGGVTYESVSKSFQTGCLEQELQIVQLSATRCNYIAILWVNLVSFAAITPCVASQWVFIVVSIYFIINSVQKLLDTLLYDGFLECFKQLYECWQKCLKAVTYKILVLPCWWYGSCPVTFWSSHVIFSVLPVN
jgi:hypothetical protein